MGAMDNVVGEILEERRRLAWREVAAILASPTPLFTIAGGSVKIFSITAWIVEEIADAAVTWHMTLDAAVDLDAALFAATGGPNEMVAWPLDDNAALIAPAAVAQSPPILARAANVVGISSGPADIILTYAVGVIDGTVGFSVEWEKLSPNASIVPV